MSTRMSSNKKRDMEAPDDDNEYDEDYKDKGRLNDALLRKIGMLHQKCIKNERIINRLKMDLRLPKSHVRKTKRQIRIGYNRDGKEANFSDSVLSFVKEYLFPHFKFLKVGWMEYDKGQESFLTFVQGMVKIPEGAECVCVCGCVLVSGKGGSSCKACDSNC
jgi:hypothetical protein